MLNPVRSFEKLASALSDENDVLVFCKDQIPWKEDFFDKIQKELGDITVFRFFKIIKSEKNTPPGQTVLDNLCSHEIQAGYWPDQTYAQYLSGLEDIPLNSLYVWVEGISSEDELSRWLGFVNDYKKLSEGCQNSRAVFILECVGAFSFETKSKYFVSINMTPDEFDRHMFCMVNTFEVNCSYALKQYIAELAFNLAGDNIELCGLLAKQGMELVHQPHITYQNVCEKLQITGDLKKDNSRLDRDIIVSQMRTVFPMLEQRRYMFIEKYVKGIEKILPVKNSLDELVKDPFELELSTLVHIVNLNLVIFSDEDKSNLRICREIRNKIAHNERVKGKDIETLYGMFI